MPIVQSVQQIPIQRLRACHLISPTANQTQLEPEKIPISISDKIAYLHMSDGFRTYHNANADI